MKTLKTILPAALLLVLPIAAHATPYEVDYKASEISFSGTHAGNNFQGVFEEWDATIDFNAEQPELSTLNANFDLSKAKTGNAMFDGALPKADWFDVKNHAEAKFVSTKVSKNTDGSYVAEGNLTLRGITHPASLSFTLTDLAKAEVEAEGKLTIDRLAYDIGKKSDATAEWVSQEIAVAIKIKATKTIP